MNKKTAIRSTPRWTEQKKELASFPFIPYIFIYETGTIEKSPTINENHSGSEDLAASDRAANDQ